MKSDRFHGFTLIELLVVIAIMGILVTIGLFAYTAAQQRGHDSKRKQELSKIADALEMYANDFNSYPSGDINGFILGCGTGVATCGWGSAFYLTNGTTYMAKLPQDPLASDPLDAKYRYRYVRSGAGYYLFARLERSDDADIAKATIAGKDVPTTYTVDCGTVGKCNYAIRSPNLRDTPAIVNPAP